MLLSGQLEEMETIQAVLLFLVFGGLKYTNVESAVLNVTLQGLAFQSSSVSGQGEAHLAIDGNTNTDFLKGSCSQTTNEYQPWWTVDLRRGYYISNVTITSQLATTTQVPWAEIHVGESLENYGVYNPSCSVISSMRAGTTTTFPCGGIYGRYVTVVIPSRTDTLTLCEVQVGTLNVPDRQLGLMITSTSTPGTNVLQSAEIMQALRENIKTDNRVLGMGIDNVLQRVNQTCIPVRTASTAA
ncbi:fucolectin-1-like [Hyla sarda]|uniref:fucolectin-1-like n=1 Tax=Hyla sarda TaxID=327740 RepID=UPI0024C2A01A|nr:fucolectin-1-like [Hyla sarda]